MARGWLRMARGWLGDSPGPAGDSSGSVARIVSPVAVRNSADHAPAAIAGKPARTACNSARVTHIPAEFACDPVGLPRSGARFARYSEVSCAPGSLANRLALEDGRRVRTHDCTLVGIARSRVAAFRTAFVANILAVKRTFEGAGAPLQVARTAAAGTDARLLTIRAWSLRIAGDHRPSFSRILIAWRRSCLCKILPILFLSYFTHMYSEQMNGM
jgi:hypothetical protein